MPLVRATFGNPSDNGKPSHTSKPWAISPLVQRWTNFLCTGPDSQCFRRYESGGLWPNNSTALLKPQSCHGQYINEGVWLCASQTTYGDKFEFYIVFTCHKILLLF